MTNTVSTPGAVAWQRMGRVTGVAGLAAVVLIFVPIVVGMRTEPAFTATATEFLTYYKSPTQHAWRPVPVFRLHRNRSGPRTQPHHLDQLHLATVLPDLLAVGDHRRHAGPAPQLPAG
jgi:hypothetical protein